MRHLLLLLLATSVAASAQDLRPIQPGDVLTATAAPGETVILDLNDLSFDYGGYDGMRFTLVSPSADTLYGAPGYSFMETWGRTVWRFDDADPGTWTVHVGAPDGARIEGALWATATPPALTVHEAAAAGDLDALRAALPSADLESVDLDYHTPLMLATLGGHAEAVRLLLAAGADVHATAGDPEVAADIDPEDEPEMSLATPLHLGARSGDAETVRVLLDAGADPNARGVYGGTPLLRAVYGSSAVVQILLDAGADPTLASEYQGTPADVARDRIASVERVAARSSDPSEYDDRRADLAATLALLE